MKAGLSLYKVQHGIYLLDFQKVRLPLCNMIVSPFRLEWLIVRIVDRLYAQVEGDPFSFMHLCSLIITELKTLAAAARQPTSGQHAAAADGATSSAPTSQSVPYGGRSPPPVHKMQTLMGAQQHGV